MEETYIQTKLRSLSSNSVTFCWVNKHHKFKEGSIISFRGSPERYEVVRKYKQPYPKSQLHQDWKVGGLT